MRQQKTRIIFLLAVFLVVIVIIVYNRQQKIVLKEIQNTYALSAKELDLLQEGDIILRKGFGSVSDLISRLITYEYKVSHCGFLFKEDSGWVVVHTVSNALSGIDGMQKDEIDIFSKQSEPHSIVVLRYKDGNHEGIEKLKFHAYDCLDKKIPFDNNFNHNDTSSFYCTELIHFLFSKTYQCDLFQNNKHDPMDFTFFGDTALFEIVLNHQIITE